MARLRILSRMRMTAKFWRLVRHWWKGSVWCTHNYLQGYTARLRRCAGSESSQRQAPESSSASSSVTDLETELPPRARPSPSHQSGRTEMEHGGHWNNSALRARPGRAVARSFTGQLQGCRSSRQLGFAARGSFTQNPSKLLHHTTWGLGHAAGTSGGLRAGQCRLTDRLRVRSDSTRQPSCGA